MSSSNSSSFNSNPKSLLGSLKWSSEKSDALTRSSSHFSHQISRDLASQAVDAVNFCKGLNLEVEKGGKFVKLQGKLGDDEYEKLLDDKGLALVNIHYCQRGLQELKGSLDDLSKGVRSTSDRSQAQITEKFKQVRSLINHDYLILELQPGDPSADKVYILAHKLAKGDGKNDKAGIHIDSISAEDVPQELHEGVKLYTINCGKKPFSLKAVLDVLKEWSPHYSLRDANCWVYATAIAKKLAFECAHVARCPEEKARLLREHHNLEANLNSRNLVNMAKSLKSWISANMSSSR